MAAILPAEDGGGQIIDGQRVAQPCAVGRSGRDRFSFRLLRGIVQKLPELVVVRHVGRRVALEYDRRRRPRFPLNSHIADLV